MTSAILNQALDRARGMSRIANDYPGMSPTPIPNPNPKPNPHPNPIPNLGHPQAIEQLAVLSVKIESFLTFRLKIVETGLLMPNYHRLVPSDRCQCSLPFAEQY